MSAKEDAAFQAYLEDLKSAVPSELHAHLEALAAHEAFKTTSAKGYLRQDEFHRRLNDISAQKKALEDREAFLEGWFNEEKPKNQRLAAEKQELEQKVLAAQKALVEMGIPADQVFEGNPMNVVAHGTKSEIEELKKKIEEMDKARQQMDTALPYFLKDVTKVTHQILKGNYDLDPADVLDYSMQRRVTPEVAFHDLTKAEDEKRREAEIQKRIDAAREEERRAVLSQRPTPDFTGRPAANPIITSLQQAKDPSDSLSRRQSAKDLYRDMISKGEYTPDGRP